jgi:hypothetical protein
VSPSNVPPDDMSGADERFERALGDEQPPSPEGELEAFVRDVREAFPAQPMLAEESHLEAVVHVARDLAADRVPPGRRKESHVRIPRLRSRAALIVAGLVVVMSSFGGLAFAGALPGGVQNGVANVVAPLGVDLPGGDDDTTAIAPSSSQTETPEPSETESPEPSETESPEPTETQSPDASENQQDEQGQNDGGDQESSDTSGGQDEQSGSQDGGSGDTTGSDLGSGDQSGSSDGGSSDGGSSDGGSSDGGSSDGGSSSGD